MTKDLVGRVVVKLARNTYFGEAVLAASTITGNANTRPLDPSQLASMRGVIRNYFGDTSPTEFEIIWSKCIDSIARACNYTRKH